ncbi:hypothetical protein [Natronobacterium texcoconense]|uniref:hypothetical protein n=1 Tax=Natronobacterium texcoconense TaxID=1095778 RepID=UPI0014818F91|nr:hypothetical protein [Natronobacterium texcoconense]
MVGSRSPSDEDSSRSSSLWLVAVAIGLVLLGSSLFVRSSILESTSAVAVL